jgi:hypothetical protein
VEKKERNTRLVDRRQRLVESVVNTARNQKQVKRADKMKITEKELKDLIKEVILESHSKADEKTLKKMAKKLRSSSKMHGQQSKDLEGSSKLHADQADELEDIVDRSDDEELKEGDEPVTENVNCGCGNDPCITFGVISIEEAREIVREEIQADLDEAKKKKKKKSAKDRMKCNSPRRIRKGEAGHGKKKFVVKACKDGKEKIIRYGDANLEIKKDSPKRRKSFRARHKCDTAKDKMSARYWSCKKW